MSPSAISAEMRVRAGVEMRSSSNNISMKLKLFVKLFIVNIGFHEINTRYEMW